MPVENCLTCTKVISKDDADHFLDTLYINKNLFDFRK